MLTTQQLAAVKADILANPTLAAYPNTADGAFEIAAYYALNATPNLFVWRTNVPIDEIMFNGFDWTRIDNLTVGKARIWEEMIGLGHINPAQANVRAGVLAAFGTTGDLAMRTAIFGHCQRPANWLEKLFATGIGTTTTDQGTGPATMVFEGTVSYIDIQQARNS